MSRTAERLRDRVNGSRGLVCLMAAVTTACHRAPRPDSSWTALVQFDSVVALRTAVVRDTVEVGDAVELWVVLSNGGPPAEINNHPDRLFITVETPSGQRIDPFQVTPMDGFLGGMAVLVLPRKSALAQLLALDCVGIGYGPRVACDYGYRLPGPGAYRIIATFRGLNSNETGGAVLADTATVVVRPLE